MQIKVIWPGKTQNIFLRGLEDVYLKKIGRLAPCRRIQSKEAKGIPEKQSYKILHKEAAALERHIGNDYVICLTDKGKTMPSKDLASLFNRLETGPERFVSFIVGGFLGLDERILEKADMWLSLSPLTFSHELCRVMLLEQIYRSLSIIRGMNYAK